MGGCGRYPIRYIGVVTESTIIARARRGSGLSQRELARRSGTSQPTLSTYEHGSKSPTLAVAERIVNTSGYDLTLTPRVRFTTFTGARGEPFVVPDRLWRLDPADAIATVTLPLHLHWSGPSRSLTLRDRRDRARIYEIVLREGTTADLLTYVDGVLLVDLWDQLVLPPQIRAAWEPLIARFEGSKR
jgi:transcriptional regulator with XRE-family HTH domain